MGHLGFIASRVPAEVSVRSEPAIFIPIMRVRGEACSVAHIRAKKMIITNLKLMQLHGCKSWYEQSNLFANVP